MSSQQLDRVFSALSDATRRGILAQLSAGELTVKQLAEPFEMSQPAISKHLRVLDAAGLIRRDRRGREHFVSVRAEAAEEAADWIRYYSQFWHRHFDEVERHLATKQKR